jgi:polar amino acid transport system substrate-binding protein
MRFFKKLSIFSLLFLFLACSKSHEETYEIGIDPTFFPLALNQEAVQVFAFATDVLREISALEKVSLSKVILSWDNLIESLYLEKTRGVLSSAPPNLINKSKFSFSDPILMTGPVLVTKINSKKNELKDYKSFVVAMGKSSEELDLIKQYPDIEFVFYDSIIDGLEGIETEKYSAALIPSLPAHAYIRDLFQNSLKISSDGITNQAIRLITLKDKETRLIEIFDKGLERLHMDGKLKDLLFKWSLPENDLFEPEIKSKTKPLQ